MLTVNAPGLKNRSYYSKKPLLLVNKRGFIRPIYFKKQAVLTASLLSKKVADILHKT